MCSLCVCWQIMSLFAKYGITWIMPTVCNVPVSSNQLLLFPSLLYYQASLSILWFCIHCSYIFSRILSLHRVLILFSIYYGLKTQMPSNSACSSFFLVFYSWLCYKLLYGTLFQYCLSISSIGLKRGVCAHSLFSRSSIVQTSCSVFCLGNKKQLISYLLAFNLYNHLIWWKFFTICKSFLFLLRFPEVLARCSGARL